MRFKLEIASDNDELVADADEAKAALQKIVRSVLRDLSEEGNGWLIRYAGESFPIRDSNGNRIGYFTFEPGETEG
jgi:hypothetical protein